MVFTKVMRYYTINVHIQVSKKSVITKMHGSFAKGFKENR